MTTALNSRYLIDGVPQDSTPAQMLDAVLESPAGVPAGTGMVIDESVDPPIQTHVWKPEEVDSYLSLVQDASWKLQLPFAESGTRTRVASALLEVIWRNGHFRLEDLSLKASWKWNNSPVGAQAAFYRSVSSAADFVDALGLRLSSYTCGRTNSDSSVSFKAVLSKRAEADEDIFGKRERTLHPSLGLKRAVPDSIVPDPQSWLLFVPFDTSDYRLGGSLLAQSMGLGGGVGPQIDDSDYFIDCYEVVRELVEDGIVLSAVTVGEGGLISAVSRLCAGSCGTVVDISDAIRAFEEPNVVRVLFAEVPGVVIQIRDIDFDYVDAELLLQDVAFFPLGHPDTQTNLVRIKSTAKTGIQTILESLMQNAEGED